MLLIYHIYIVILYIHTSHTHSHTHIVPSAELRIKHILINRHSGSSPDTAALGAGTVVQSLLRLREDVAQRQRQRRRTRNQIELSRDWRLSIQPLSSPCAGAHVSIGRFCRICSRASTTASRIAAAPLAIHGAAVSAVAATGASPATTTATLTSTALRTNKFQNRSSMTIHGEHHTIMS